MLFVLLAATLGSIYGTFALFRIQKTLPTWARVLTWIAIVALAVLAFAGVACAGCVALFSFKGF